MKIYNQHIYKTNILPKPCLFYIIFYIDLNSIREIDSFQFSSAIELTFSCRYKTFGDELLQ